MSGCDHYPINRKQIRDWIRRHPESLPATLAELSWYPQPFRREMATMVAPDVRLRLWHEHLQALIGPSSPLAADQREFLEATIDELPSLFESPAPNPIMSDWEGRMAEHFTTYESRRVFVELGAPEPPGGIPLPPDALPES